MRRTVLGIAGIAATPLLGGCSAPSSATGGDGGTPAQFIVGKWSCVAYRDGNKTDEKLTFDVASDTVTITDSQSASYKFQASYSIVGDTFTGKNAAGSSVGRPGQTGTITSFPVKVPDVDKKVALSFKSDQSDETTHITAYRDGEGHVFLEEDGSSSTPAVLKCSK